MFLDALKLFVENELDFARILDGTKKIEEKDINFKVDDVSDDIVSVNFDDLKIYFDDDALISANTIIAEKRRLIDSYGSKNKICVICEEPEIPYRKLTSCEKCNVTVHRKCHIKHAC